MLKFISISLLLIDAYLGTRFLLNVLNLLHTSKYSKGATLAYAIIFLALAATGLVMLYNKSSVKILFWLSIGPWILIIVALFLNMLFGDYK